MIGRTDVRAGGCLFANHEDYAVAEQDTNRLRGYPGDIHDDLDATCCLEHVQQGIAFPRIHPLIDGQGGLEVGEQLTNIVPEFTKVAGRCVRKLDHSVPIIAQGT